MVETHTLPSLPPVLRKPRPSKYPFATMKVGEYFFVPNKTENTFSAYASLWGQKTGRQFATRLCHMRRDKAEPGWVPCKPDERGAKLGVGCWRMPDKAAQ